MTLFGLEVEPGDLLIALAIVFGILELGGAALSPLPLGPKIYAGTIGVLSILFAGWRWWRRGN